MSFFAALHRPVRLLLGVLSAAGLLISLWAHALAVFGLDPRDFFRPIWIVEPALTAVVLPLAVPLFRHRLRNNPFELSPRARVALYWALGYYAFHFYRFLYRASQELRSSDTWQMVSAGWMLLFLLAILYYTREKAVTPPPLEA